MGKGASENAAPTSSQHGVNKRRQRQAQKCPHMGGHPVLLFFLIAFVFSDSFVLLFFLLLLFCFCCVFGIAFALTFTDFLPLLLVCFVVFLLLVFTFVFAVFWNRFVFCCFGR